MYSFIEEQISCLSPEMDTNMPRTAKDLTTITRLVRDWVETFDMSAVMGTVARYRFFICQGIAERRCSVSEPLRIFSRWLAKAP